MNEENHITFKYQGDDFYIAAEEENRFIMIWNPWWGSINADNEALPYLKEIINLANVNSLVTTVYMVDEDEKTIGLHSRCHTFFSPREGELEEHMKMLLDYFFDMHNVIKDNMNQLGQAAINEEEKKERVKVKGFSAYKDNTMPIEAKTSLMVVGQIMEAILSGKYDTDHLAVIISQTGGGCRASNYIGFIRRALKKAGYGHIPVISINLSGLESNPGFKITLPLVLKGVYGLIFGDLFMRCLYRVRPYEAVPGSANTMHKKWEKTVIEFIKKGYPSRHEFKRLCRQIVEDFDSLPLKDVKKPRVGVVGEILVKFLPDANNHLVELLPQGGTLL